MAAIRDQRGDPVRLQLRFWPSADLTDASGAVDLGRTTTVEPCATVDVEPEVFLGAALADLGFAIARHRPAYAGAALPVGVRFAPGPEPSAPTLVAKDPAAVARSSWPAAAELWQQLVPIRALDPSRVVAHLRKRGVAPGELRFSVVPVPLRVAPAARRCLAPLGAPGRNASVWLELAVPSFPEGQVPAEDWRELDQDAAAAADLPVYLPIPLLNRLVAGEAAHVEASGERWTERCWFLLGDLLRTGGDLGAVVRRVLPAREVTASACALSFSPATWLALRAELERAGEHCLGWIHSHSLGALGRLAAAQRRAEPGAAALAGDPPPGEAGEAAAAAPSALFLSADDIDSAGQRGFRAPWTVTAVLDADACLLRARGEPVPLRDLLGVWGWWSGLLARRSLRLSALAPGAVKDAAAPAHHPVAEDGVLEEAR